MAQSLPGLQITASNISVVVSWPTTNIGSFYTLQAATNLSYPVQWRSFSYGPDYAKGNFTTVIYPSPRFFRLGGVLPIFQFAIFYGPDLEINPGPVFYVSGKVHSNGNIWATGASSNSPLTFSDVVEAAGNITLTGSPNDPNNASRHGNVIFLDTTNNPTGTVPPLLPYQILVINPDNNPTNMAGMLNLPPVGLGAPVSVAYTPDGQVYPFNEADLIISNSASGLAGSGNSNLSVYYQDQFNGSALIKVQPDAASVVGVTTNRYFSFVTNVSFYDFREYCTVQAIQIDVAKLRAWLTNTASTGGAQYNTENIGDKGHGINGIYVYSSVPLHGGNPTTIGQLPAVRVINGQQLPPAGLTIATPQPLYVKANYNVTTDGTNFAFALGSTTSNAAPAAFMADAITILSTNWYDTAAGYIKGGSLNNRTAADTTINAAILQGIVPSQLDAAGIKHYSGGLEQSLRLLENWGTASGHGGSAVLTCNGSFVALFPSRYATNYWRATGEYYNAPLRQWGFDTNFLQSNRLPPFTPLMVNSP